MKNGEKKGFSKGYSFAMEVVEVLANDPRCEVPRMPDSLVAKETLKEEGDAEATGTSEQPSEENPPTSTLENTTNEAIHLSP